MIDMAADIPLRRRLGEADGFCRDIGLARRPMERKLLRGAAVTVARIEIHPAVKTGGILAEPFLDEARLVEILVPGEEGADRCGLDGHEVDVVPQPERAALTARSVARVRFERSRG